MRISRIEEELSIPVEEYSQIEKAPVKWELHQAGMTWTGTADSQLKEDFNKAVRWMAMRQGRTALSIKCRLKHNFAIGEDE